jgi:hypothetical protein
MFERARGFESHSPRHIPSKQSLKATEKTFVILLDKRGLIVIVGFTFVNFSYLNHHNTNIVLFHVEMAVFKIFNHIKSRNQLKMYIVFGRTKERNHVLTQLVMEATFEVI